MSRCSDNGSSSQGPGEPVIHSSNCPSRANNSNYSGHRELVFDGPLDGVPAATERPDTLSRTKRTKHGSRTLTIHQVRECVEAAAHSHRLGLPFNKLITINWQDGGVTNAVGATGCFLKSMLDYLRSLGSSTAYFWVLENGPVHGVHVHFLLHVDHQVSRKVSRFHRRWLTGAGARFHKGLILSRPVGLRLSHCLGAGDPSSSYDSNLAVAVEYLLKNTEPCTRATFPNRFSPRSGLILGKRCGTSENIGKAARARAELPS